MVLALLDMCQWSKLDVELGVRRSLNIRERGILYSSYIVLYNGDYRPAIGTAVLECSFDQFASRSMHQWAKLLSQVLLEVMRELELALDIFLFCCPNLSLCHQLSTYHT
jgi:hypothetical protein